MPREDIACDRRVRLIEYAVEYLGVLFSRQMNCSLASFPHPNECRLVTSAVLAILNHGHGAVNRIDPHYVAGLDEISRRAAADHRCNAVLPSDDCGV